MKNEIFKEEQLKINEITLVDGKVKSSVQKTNRNISDQAEKIADEVFPNEMEEPVIDNFLGTKNPPSA
jgi:hypothetical protein